MVEGEARGTDTWSMYLYYSVNESVVKNYISQFRSGVVQRPAVKLNFNLLLDVSERTKTVVER